MVKVDMRAAINAVSDVVQNRPRPLREFDQIHMKTGDMVMQSEVVAAWADGKRLAFIGDGDAVSVSVAYLKRRGGARLRTKQNNGLRLRRAHRQRGQTLRRQGAHRAPRCGAL